MRFSNCEWMPTEWLLKFASSPRRELRQPIQGTNIEFIAIIKNCLGIWPLPFRYINRCARIAMVFTASLSLLPSAMDFSRERF
ncbi:hypothetical protein QWZ13_01205 [Reinekea marina]|uniref:hypothetical protein n=1 Tax=Reinekea marina TaxID=1310421 RepID=UPI0025B5E98D|nr:hypothetical protein [Reinekea marina]MDN3647520.1 hypothetical protein [Reinekea marina]